MSAKAVKYWREFASGKTKDGKFQLLLWQGIPGDEERAQVWPVGVNEDPFAGIADASHLGPSAVFGAASGSLTGNVTSAATLTADAMLELESAQRAGRLPKRTAEQNLSAATLSTGYHQRVGARELLPGAACLASVVLEVTHDEDAALRLVGAVLSRTGKYAGTSEVQSTAPLDRDVLVLASLLWAEEPKLCAFLNSAGFDVVDLRDVTASWVSAALAGHFGAAAIRRAIDLVLLEGASSLLGFVYGVFRATSSRLQEEAPDHLFAHVASLPARMSDDDLEECWKKGYETLVASSSRVESLRVAKDWDASVECPGALVFSDRVGDAEWHRQQTKKNHDQALAAAETASAAASLELVRSTASDKQLARLIGDAQRELRRLSEHIVQLQQDNEAMEQRLQDELGGATSMDESMSSLESDALSDDASPHPAGADRRPTMSAAPSVSRGPSLVPGVVPPGFVLHSKLFQHQQFPCLYMEGYLLKAARHVGGGGQAVEADGYGALHRRFFVLQGSFLTYFKSHRNSKPGRDLSVDMHGRRVNHVEKHRLGKYGFEISDQLDPEEPFIVLFASSDDERNVWVQVLQAATEN